MKAKKDGRIYWVCGRIVVVRKEPTPTTVGMIKRIIARVRGM